jgi:hypothetical protein
MADFFASFASICLFIILATVRDPFEAHLLGYTTQAEVRPERITVEHKPNGFHGPHDLERGSQFDAEKLRPTCIMIHTTSDPDLNLDPYNQTTCWAKANVGLGIFPVSSAGTGPHQAPRRVSESARSHSRSRNRSTSPSDGSRVGQLGLEKPCWTSRQSSLHISSDIGRSQTIIRKNSFGPHRALHFSGKA